jgi:hypothetical protein
VVKHSLSESGQTREKNLSGDFVAGTGDNRTTVKVDDGEVGDLREWTSVGHKNIGIGDKQPPHKIHRDNITNRTKMSR